MYDHLMAVEVVVVVARTITAINKEEVKMDDEVPAVFSPQIENAAGTSSSILLIHYSKRHSLLRCP